MSEQLAGRIPRDEDLSAEYKGITWADFQHFTDEQVDEIRRQRKNELLSRLTQKVSSPLEELPPNQGELDEEFWHSFNESQVLHNFTTWRKFGIPERDTSYEELIERVEDSVAARIAADPNFGKLTDEQYRDLPESERSAVFHVFQYFFNMRHVSDYPVIDDYSLSHTIGLGEEDVGALVRNDVLEFLSSNPMSGNHYLLKEPYYNHWLVLSFEQEPE